MNIVLWIVQAFLASAFISVGFKHAFKAAEMMKARAGMDWIGAVPKPLMTFIGICEMAGGVGVILPMLTGVLPWLTPLAAALLATVMVLAFVFHVVRKEYRNLTINTFLLVLSIIVAYGRWDLWS